MDDHKVIWLEPACHGDGPYGNRQWCQDNVWSDGCECDVGGHKPTRYIRADLATPEATGRDE
jgi:hypothetical protein